jgi:hypothetical protein
MAPCRLDHALLLASPFPSPFPSHWPLQTSTWVKEVHGLCDKQLPVSAQGPGEMVVTHFCITTTHSWLSQTPRSGSPMQVPWTPNCLWGAGCWLTAVLFHGVCSRDAMVSGGPELPPKLCCQSGGRLCPGFGLRAGAPWALARLRVSAWGNAHSVLGAHVAFCPTAACGSPPLNLCPWVHATTDALIRRESAAEGSWSPLHTQVLASVCMDRTPWPPSSPQSAGNGVGLCPLHCPGQAVP